MSSSRSSATPTKGKHSPKHQQSQSRERMAPDPQAAPHQLCQLPSHHPGPTKTPSELCVTVRKRHTHPEFPSHLPEKCKEVSQSTEHEPEVQSYDKRSPRAKAGLYFSPGIPSKRVPPPAFQITADKTATKMQNWFRKYLIISF